MSTLDDSVFSFLYSIPNLRDDFEIVHNFSIIFSVVTVISGLWSILSPAAYGRHSKATYSRIPKIQSRGAWTISFAPVLIIASLIILGTPCLKLGNKYNLFAFYSFVVHYANRVLYATKISKRAQPMSISFLPLLIGSASLNAFLQCHHLANVHESTPSSVAFVGGFFVLTGLSINVYHDNILLSLRQTKRKPKTELEDKKTKKNKSKAKQNESKPKSEHKGYKIPQGGLFEYISCANYFGEIIEWCGFALISRGAPQILFALFSTTFLGIRALQHHKFYKKTFADEYPPNRKAIIPFIL